MVVNDSIWTEIVAVGAEGFPTTNAKDCEAGQTPSEGLPGRKVNAHLPRPFQAGLEYSTAGFPRSLCKLYSDFFFWGLFLRKEQPVF